MYVITMDWERTEMISRVLLSRRLGKSVLARSRKENSMGFGFARGQWDLGYVDAWGPPERFKSALRECPVLPVTITRV